MRYTLFAFLLLSSIPNVQACWIVDEVDSLELQEFPLPADITVERFSLDGTADSKPEMATVRIQLWLDLIRSTRFGRVQRVQLITYEMGNDPTREDVEVAIDVPLREETFEFTMPISDLRRSRLCIDGRGVEKFLPCAGGTFIYRLPEK